jgi:hypothetical protein
MRHYMRHYRQELTLENALTDPLVRTVMAADGVDPQELNSMLHEIVAALAQRARHPVERASLHATNCA